MNLQSLSQIDPKFLELEKEREELTKVKNIDRIFFGRFEIGTWYFSPYPDAFGAVKDLYVCEFCLKYMKLGETWVKHQKECSPKSPPGKRVYAKDTHAVFEVDGKTDKVCLSRHCLILPQ